MLAAIRSVKIPGTGGMVAFDWAATAIAAAVIPGPFVRNLFVLLLLSVALHHLFGVATVTNHRLGLSDDPRASTGKIELNRTT